MWKIRELKKKARSNIKQNYWAMIAVCFIMALLVSEYSVSGVLFARIEGSADGNAITKAEQEVQMIENGDELDMLTPNDGYAIEGITPSDVIQHYAQEITGIEVPEEGLNATQGVLATLVNGWLRGVNILKYAVITVDSFLLHHERLEWLVALLLVVANVLFFVFVKNILLIGERRFFLENNRYHDTQIRRIMVLYKEKKVLNPAKIMLMKTVFNALWGLTIVGGIYKYYEYKMIRYILAENPDIGWRECFKLSKQMTRGCKWNMFLVDCSFIGWYLLSILLAGIPALLYVNPYYTATEAEIYFTLRDRAYVEGLEGFELLNDDLLVHEPEERVKDIYFSLEIKIHDKPFKSWKKYYSPVNMLMFFFTFMFIGWCWEVIYTFMLHGELCNRGSLHGPWLPIYGFGGAMVILLFRKIGEKPHMVFILSFICCGIMEYCTGWYFDNIKGIKYWDYSNYFLNLNGYICLEGLLMFAFLASVGFYLIAPLFDDWFNKIPLRVRSVLLCIFVPLFLFDVGYSHFHPNVGEGIGGADYEQ